MDLEEKEDFLGRWANGSLTEDERREFEKSDDFKVFQKILEGSSKFSISTFDAENSLKKTKEQLEQRSKSRVRSLIPVWSVAAAVVLLFVFYFVFTASKTLKTDFGEVAEEVLPDGSKVHVNAQTTLNFSPRNWEEERRVNLEGEAYFEVAKGTTFTVVSEYGNVKVLGTQFNVYSRGGVFEVRCFEGKVKVAGSEEAYLTAGESYRQIDGEVDEIVLTNEGRPDWMNNESTFKSSPVSSVLLGLTNQYDLKFEGNIPDDSIRVTVSFPNDNEKLALDLVFKSLQKQYKKKSDKVVFID